MKFLLALAALLILTSCGGISRGYTRWTGELTYKCAKTHVLYVQSDSGLAPLYDLDGKLVRCEEQ